MTKMINCYQSQDGKLVNKNLNTMMNAIVADHCDFKPSQFLDPEAAKNLVETQKGEILSNVKNEGKQEWIVLTNELAVFQEWMDVFVDSTRGKVASTEGQAQDVVKMQTLCEYYKASDRNYMLKAKILDFTFNAYVETEVEFNEDVMFIFDLIFLVTDEVKMYIAK